MRRLTFDSHLLLAVYGQDVLIDRREARGPDLQGCFSASRVT